MLSKRRSRRRAAPYKLSSPRNLPRGRAQGNVNPAVGDDAVSLQSLVASISRLPTVYRQALIESQHSMPIKSPYHYAGVYNVKLEDVTKQLKELKTQVTCNNALSVDYTFNDVDNLMMILQPLTNSWHELGKHLLDKGMSAYEGIPENDPVLLMDHVIRKWCIDKGTSVELEEAMKKLGMSDLLSDLRKIKHERIFDEITELLFKEFLTKSPDFSGKSQLHLIDFDKQFKLDDISHLNEILQSLQEYWYLLGHHLNMDMSAFSEVKEVIADSAAQMELVIRIWCINGGTLMKLEQALKAMGRDDLIFQLRNLLMVNGHSAASIDKCIQCDHWENTDHFESMLTVGSKVRVYRADTEHDLTLEECGLKLFIPEEVVAPPESVYEVATRGLWGGEFIFPEGATLISGVCYISLSSSSHLNKPVTIHLEHCANIAHQDQARYLSFVIANSDKPPYKFQLVPGGIFDVHARFGAISVDKLSLVAIVLISCTAAVTGIVIGALLERVTSSLVCIGAAGLVGGALIGGAAVVGGMPGATIVGGILSLAAYSGSKARSPPNCNYKVLMMVKIEHKCFAINFAVIPASNFIEEIQKKTNSLGVLKHLYYFDFISDEAACMIEINDIQENSVDGWKIAKSFSLKVTKKEVTIYTQSTRAMDSSSSWPQPPHVCIRLQPDPENESAFKDSVIFKCNLTVSGTTYEINLPLSYSELHVTQDSMSQSTGTQGSNLYSKPRIGDLTMLLAPVAPQYNTIGTCLHVPMSQLGLDPRVSHQDNLRTTLQWWINNGGSPHINSPVTWDNIIKVFENGPAEVQNYELAQKIKQFAMSSTCTSAQS